MKTNVVLVDRTFRMGAGVLLLASPVLDFPSYPFNLLGLLLMGTAAVGYCPLYGWFAALRPRALASVAARGKLEGTP